MFFPKRVFHLHRHTSGRQAYSKLELEAFVATVRDPDPVPRFFLRGRDEALIDLCPKFPNSVAPVLFHLPERTAARILENISSDLIAPAFVENGRSSFGLNPAIVLEQLPRWRCNPDKRRAAKLAVKLSFLIMRKSHSIAEHLLPDVVDVTGRLVKSNIIPVELSNEVLKEVLPICLDRKSLSRQDMLKIVSGVGMIPVTRENAILFPMISNFATWFLQRNRINRLRRLAGRRNQSRKLPGYSENAVRKLNS